MTKEEMENNMREEIENKTKEEIKNKMKELKSSSYDLIAYRQYVENQLLEKTKQLQELSSELAKIQNEKQTPA